jgi:hypothetical protein
MRVLLYGMQSSGASALTLTLAQKRDSVAFIDIWNMFAAPKLATERDVVAKVVVTSAFPLDVHRRRFRPDVTFLVLRHPVDNYYSLMGKTYANESGLIDEKFAILEEVLRAGTGYDHILYYEDFVFSPRGLIDLCRSIGWQINYDALHFQRTESEIEDFDVAACPGLREQLKYGMGNVCTTGLLRNSVKFAEPWGRTSHLPQLCPSVFQRYAEARADRGAQWHLPERALLSCSLSTILRELTASGTIPERSERFGYRLTLTGHSRKCRVTDTALVLCPDSRGGEVRLTVSGLPGRPFNRIAGTAFAMHPRALGTQTRIGIDGHAGERLAEQEFTLCHCNMRSIDLAFKPQDSTVRLSLSVGLAPGVKFAVHSEVCLLDLRLEQVAT